MAFDNTTNCVKSKRSPPSSPLLSAHVCGLTIYYYIIFVGNEFL